MWVKSSIQDKFINIDTGAQLTAVRGMIIYHAPNATKPERIFMSDDQDKIIDKLHMLMDGYIEGNPVYYFE